MYLVFDTYAGEYSFGKTEKEAKALAEEWLAGYSDDIPYEIKDGAVGYAKVVAESFIEVTDTKEECLERGEDWIYGDWDFVGVPTLKVIKYKKGSEEK